MFKKKGFTCLDLFGVGGEDNFFFGGERGLGKLNFRNKMRRFVTVSKNVFTYLNFFLDFTYKDEYQSVLEKMPQRDGFLVVEVKQINGRGRQYTVNLEKKTCSCGYFQLAGLPCHHAISAIYKC
jgi:hypothetical protein